MARSLVAYYESIYSAEKAVHELTGKGFEREMINVLLPTNTEQHEKAVMSKLPEALETEVPLENWLAGMQAGMGVGSALGIAGGVLVNLGILQIPGMEALLPNTLPGVITSFLVWAAAFLATGGVFGAVTGALIGLRIPEDEVRQYAKTVRKGKVLVTLLADWDMVDNAIEIMNHHRPLQVKEESISHWRIDQIGQHASQPNVYGKIQEHQHLQ